MSDTKNFSFEHVLKLIIKAISKGIGEDIRNYLDINKKFTNNAIIFLRSDNINTNLKEIADTNNLILKRFRRFLWDGVVIIDEVHKKTITISSRNTLDRLRKNGDRKSPHYIQSLCAIENKGLVAKNKQINFGDICKDFDFSFSDDYYEKDFDSIIGNVIERNEGYRHYVISYEADSFGLRSASIFLLDKDLDIAEEKSLTEFIQPDFGILTEKDQSFSNGDKDKKDIRDLIKIKPNLSSKKAKESNKKTEFIPIQEVNKKQA